jgi:hypothetical protein
LAANISRNEYCGELEITQLGFTIKFKFEFRICGPTAAVPLFCFIAVLLASAQPLDQYQDTIRNPDRRLWQSNRTEPYKQLTYIIQRTLDVNF